MATCPELRRSSLDELTARSVLNCIAWSLALPTHSCRKDLNSKLKELEEDSGPGFHQETIKKALFHQPPASLGLAFPQG